MVSLFVQEYNRHHILKVTTPEVDMKPLYPYARTVTQIDNYHGALVSDPYRWLEDVDSEETLEWIRQQNELTFSFLERIPARQKIQNRLNQLWNFSRSWAPWKKGKRYFQERNSGLHNQSILYVMENLHGEPRVLLNPEHFLRRWNGCPDLPFHQQGWQLARVRHFPQWYRLADLAHPECGDRR